MGFLFKTHGKPWVNVTCFAEDHPTTQPAHFSLRITKKGRVNMADVKRFLLGGVYKIPLRYFRAGMRECNPDVGWPEELLMDGTPEFFVSIENVDPGFLERFRAGSLARGVEDEWEEPGGHVSPRAE